MPVPNTPLPLRSRRPLMAVAMLATSILLPAATLKAVPAVDRATVRSPDLVKQLIQTMTERGLTAVAAKDPEAANGYVAAMLFPGVQLLVIAARSDAGAYIDSAMSSQQYANAYAALQQGVPESKLFVQDMGCDGLYGTSDRTPDIVYERGVDQHVLDGDHKRAKLSREAYATLITTLDGRYAKLLTLLLDSARAPAAAGPVRK